jgi:hypothetical protein
MRVDQTQGASGIESLWKRFNVKSKQKQLWYYEGPAEALGERSLALGDPGLTRLAGQLARTVEAIARLEPGDGGRG